MTEQHSHGKHDADLDRLLAEARWPEPAAEQVSRLRDQWRGLSRARRRRQYLVAGAAIAAAVLAFAGVSIRWQRQRDLDTTAPAPEMAAMRPYDGVGQGRVERSDVPLVRDPTLYERIILASYTPAIPKHAAAKNKRGNPHRAISTESSSSLAGTFLLTFDVLARRTSRIMFGTLRSGKQLWAGARRQGEQLVANAAARARQTQALALATSREGRAVEAVARTGEISDIVSVLMRERHRELRHRLLKELLWRATEESVEAYLAFVALPQSREEALAAMQNVGQRPCAALLVYLRSPQAEPRNAAALALANSTDPSVIAALAASLDDAGLRRQALIALLLNPTPQAAAVLHEAREDLYLMASVRAAEFELQHVTNAYER